MAAVVDYLGKVQALRRAGGDLRESGQDSPDKALNPVYFLHGDEPYLGRLFVRRLKDLLFEPGEADSNVDRFWMDESSWADVLDAARTAPTFFSPWRLILAEFLLRSEDRSSDREEDKLNDIEAGILAEYLGTPRKLPGTILVVLYPSRYKRYRYSPVFKMFSGHFLRAEKDTASPDKKKGAVRQVLELEMSSLKSQALQAWIRDELEQRKLALTADARARLAEVVGGDLQRLTSEMDKLQAYAVDAAQARAALDVEDIDRVCAWTREVESWGLTDALSVADWPRCAHVLDKLVKEGEAEMKILNDIAFFLREVLLVKGWLEAKQFDRKTIFSRLRPQIKETWGALYARKFREFFLPVERLSRPRLRNLILELSGIDAAFKSGADSKREMIESFLFGYCREAGGAGVRRTARA